MPFFDLIIWGIIGFGLYLELTSLWGLYFSLYKNSMGSEGGKAIGKALETNKTVQTIEYAQTCLVSTSL